MGFGLCYPFVICVAVTPNMAPMTISSRLMKRVDNSAAVLMAPTTRTIMTIRFSASVDSILMISMLHGCCDAASCFLSS